VLPSLLSLQESQEVFGTTRLLRRECCGTDSLSPWSGFNMQSLGILCASTEDRCREAIIQVHFTKFAEVPVHKKTFHTDKAY